MNTIPFTTEPSSPSYSNALRYLAEVAAAQEWTDALGAISPGGAIPARRRRQSRKTRPPALSLVRRLSLSGCRLSKQKVPAPEPPRKPSLKLVPWSYPPIDEDAITPPSPVEGPSAAFPAEPLAYDSELETETETELETEVESDVAPIRPRIRVVDDPTPEFEAETYKKWSCDPLVIPKTPSALIPAHPELTPVAPKTASAVDLAKLVDSVFVVEEEDDDEWLSGPPSYYTSPPESPRPSSSVTPSCSPCPTPMFTDDEYDESDPEGPDGPFDQSTDPIATHHLRTDLEIVRPFSPLAPEITFTPPTWEAIFDYMPQQDEAYGQLLALPGTTPLGPAELDHNTLVTRPRIRRNPTTGSQECMWRAKWTPCCWACGGAAEGMDTSLPASQRTGWFVLDNQRWLKIRS